MRALLAVSKGIIGCDNALPWKNKEDMAMFKAMTMDQSVIMGYNTWKSLPLQNNVKLPGRNLFVLCRPNTDIGDATAIHHIDELLEYDNSEIWCIGGMKTFNLLSPYIKEAHISTLHMTSALNLTGNVVKFEGEFADKIFRSTPKNITYTRCEDGSVNVVEHYVFD